MFYKTNINRVCDWMYEWSKFCVFCTAQKVNYNCASCWMHFKHFKKHFVSLLWYNMQTPSPFWYLSCVCVPYACMLALHMYYYRQRCNFDTLLNWRRDNMYIIRRLLMHRKGTIFNITSELFCFFSIVYVHSHGVINGY